VAANKPARHDCSVETLQRAIENYLYDLDGTLDLTMAAAEALVRGIDSPALAELAGLSKGSTYEIREVVPKVVDELAIEVSSLPEAVFRKASVPARAFLAGDLDFIAAARQVTDLFFRTDYWDCDQRPDTGLDVFDGLVLLNEWVYAVDNGHEDDGRYYFNSRTDAETCFRAVASALADPSI
jgi:hypothetical protein